MAQAEHGTATKRSLCAPVRITIRAEEKGRMVIPLVAVQLSPRKFLCFSSRSLSFYIWILILKSVWNIKKYLLQKCWLSSSSIQVPSSSPLALSSQWLLHSYLQSLEYSGHSTLFNSTQTFQFSILFYLSANQTSYFSPYN